MFAKLVISSTAVAPSLCIRDIVNLCTSNTPNVTGLVGFDPAQSVVYNSTPAGWTYEYSNRDLGTLSTSNVATNGVGDWWAMSAPCLGPSANTKKYAKLTTVYTGSNVSTYSAFCLSGATNVSGNTVTNEGFRYTTGTPANEQYAQYCSHRTITGGSYIIYLVATPRHISLFSTFMTSAIWETSISDVHTFYNSVPMVQVNDGGFGLGVTGNPSTSYVASGNVGSVVTTANLSSTTMFINSQMPASTNGIGQIMTNYNMFDVTNPTNSTYYGTLNLGHIGQFQSNTGGTFTNTLNMLCVQPYLMRTATTDKIQSISSTGENRNIVSPIFFSPHSVGYPTIYVTGVCDIYTTRASIGTTGDTMLINGVTYTYINAGTRSFAVLQS